MHIAAVVGCPGMVIRRRLTNARSVAAEIQIQPAYLDGRPHHVQAVAADSITRALVVIPTNSPQNHSKSNSALIGK